MKNMKKRKRSSGSQPSYFEASDYITPFIRVSRRFGDGSDQRLLAKLSAHQKSESAAATKEPTDSVWKCTTAITI